MKTSVMICASVLFAVAFAGAQNMPVEISVNWPPAALVAQKYGPIPVAFVFGEVIGCNRGTEAVTFGEGDVIAALRKSDTAGGLQAFSRQDAMSLVGNSQSASRKNRAIAWIKAATKTAIESKATGLIPGGNAAGLGIVLGASAIDLALPSVESVLNLRQLITYSADGLQAVMQIPAGRCTPPGSVLFAVPSPVPKQPASEPAVFTIQAPVSRQ